MPWGSEAVLAVVCFCHLHRTLLGFLPYPAFLCFHSGILHNSPNTVLSFLKTLAQFDNSKEILSCILVLNLCQFCCTKLWPLAHMTDFASGSRVFWRPSVCGGFYVLPMLLCLSQTWPHSATVCEASWWVDTTWLNGLIKLWHMLSNSLSWKQPLFLHEFLTVITVITSLSFFKIILRKSGYIIS